VINLRKNVKSVEDVPISKLFLLMFILLGVIASGDICPHSHPPAKYFVTSVSCPSEYTMGSSPLQVVATYGFENVDDVTCYTWFTGTKTDNPGIGFKSEISSFQYPPLPGGLTLSWQGTTQPGDYNIVVYLGTDATAQEHKASSKRSPRIVSISGGGGQAEYTLIKWSGDNRTGNPDEVLMDPWAYEMAVRVVDENGNGVNGVTVNFTPDKGTIWGGNPHPSSIPYAGVDGIAKVPLVLSSEIGTYTVTATSDQAVNSIIFTETCFDDHETSGDPANPHEREDYPDGTEIPGDGYHDAGESSDSKDVKIEVDYYPGAISLDSLNQVIPLVEAILETAHIDAHLTIDEEIEESMPDPINEQERKGLLTRFRDHKDYIHVIVGTRCSENPDALGIVNQYGDGTGPGSFLCAHYASGGTDFSQVYLDSCGCFVFAETIEDFNFDMGFVHCAALVMTHEIGHALGMGHTNRLDAQGQETDEEIWGHNVMVRSFPPDADFYNYNFFHPASLDNSHDDSRTWGIDAVNTRDILGIHTVDIFE